MKLYTSIFAYGGVPNSVLNTYIHLVSTIVRDRRHVEICTIAEDALISRSRCRATAQALDSGCDVWIQIDHDMAFKPEDFYGMAERALQRQATVCVPYSVRSYPPRPALRPHRDVAVDSIGRDELVPVALIATGFCAIPIEPLRQAIHKLEQPDMPLPYRVQWCSDTVVKRMPSLWHEMILETIPGHLEFLSEDYSGSARLQAVGMEQLAWLKPTLYHWGECGYTMPQHVSTVSLGGATPPLTGSTKTA